MHVSLDIIIIILITIITSIIIFFTVVLYNYNVYSKHSYINCLIVYLSPPLKVGVDYIIVSLSIIITHI